MVCGLGCGPLESKQTPMLVPAADQAQCNEPKADSVEISPRIRLLGPTTRQAQRRKTQKRKKNRY